MYTKIWSTRLEDYVSPTKDGDQNFLDVGRLNLFIGPNNSGKSRLVRHLLKSRWEELLVVHNEFSEKGLNLAKQVLQCIPDGESASEMRGDQLKILIGNQLTSLSLLSNCLLYYREQFYYAYNNKCWKSSKLEDRVLINDAAINKAIKEVVRESSDVEEVLPAMETFEDSTKYYIPTLRGIRPLHKQNNDDLLLNRTKDDYMSSREDNNLRNCEIVTGHEIYNDLRKMKYGEGEEQKQVREYEKKLGIEFFEGKSVVLTPRGGKKRVHGNEQEIDTVAVEIENERQRQIYDVGDGLQQILSITFKPFFVQEESMFFIEEPETNMHPGLLRQLIRFLMKHTKHQYFITTHSNHLLDLTEDYKDDVYIYGLKKVVDGEKSTFIIRDCAQDRNVLTELGVKPSSVYLSNSTIWVEGLTDRLYLRCFMKKYLESLEEAGKELAVELYRFMENYHYAFVEYQGGNLVHWDFEDEDTDNGEAHGLCALKVCSQAFLIADGDIRNKASRVEDLEEALGDRVFVLEGKEIENLLPVEVLIKTAEEEFERRDGPPKKKDEETKLKDKLDPTMLQSITLDQYEKSKDGVGYYLDNALALEGKWDKDTKPKPDAFFAGSGQGTIKQKGKFCEKAVEVMGKIAWENTNEAKELCEKIFEHIKNQNPK